MRSDAQDGRIAAITGTTHGIGRVTARELAQAGYPLLMLCRNLEAAAEVKTEILALRRDATVHVLPCDLASLDSVNACADAICSNFGPLSLLINNAGMVSTRQRLSADGFELTFASNHLGPFLLTSRLLGRMAPGARIINVASRAHYRGIMDLDHIEGRQAHYHARAAYARSKLANVMHTFALARRLKGSTVTANCLHPGVVATHLLPRWLRILQRLIRRVVFDEVRGARTSLHLALASDLAHLSGAYFDEHQRIQPASRLATDVELQELLWARSVRWCGLAPAAQAAPRG